MGLEIDTNKLITKVSTDTKPVTNVVTDKPVSVFSVGNIKEHKTELAITGGIATAGLIGLSLLTRKRLPKHIDFRPAKTIEEALKCSKRLKVKNVSSELNYGYMDLEELNKINGEFARLSNLSKGKVKMPKKLKFEQKEGINSFASYNTADEEMIIRDVDISNISERIKSYASKTHPQFISIKTLTGLQFDFDKCLPNDIYQLYLTYITKPYSLNKSQINTLFNYLKFWDEGVCLLNRKEETLSIISGMTCKEIASLSKKEIDRLLDLHRNKPESMEKLYKYFNERKINEFYIFDHEFAHAQFREHGKYVSNTEIWKCAMALGKDQLKDAPEIVKHFFSLEGQLIAGKVSSYAQTSVHEFLAEVYAMLVQGNKLDKEIIDMYLKCGGKIPKGLKNYII